MKKITLISFYFFFFGIANAGQLDGHLYCRDAYADDSYEGPKGPWLHCIHFRDDTAMVTGYANVVESSTFKYAVKGNDIIDSETNLTTVYFIKEGGIGIRGTDILLEFEGDRF
jgi:hypothetical protein